jgi:23S rRNA-intervening sequence protein
MGAKSFRELIAWQLARELRKAIAQLVQKPSIGQDFDLTSQLKKAARSATGNIAEGSRVRTRSSPGSSTSQADRCAKSKTGSSKRSTMGSSRPMKQRRRSN